jgi:hypothetical protein
MCVVSCQSIMYSMTAFSQQGGFSRSFNARPFYSGVVRFCYLCLGVKLSVFKSAVIWLEEYET